MTPSDVSMSVRQTNRHAIIDIKGELTASAEDALMSAYNEANRNNPSIIVLNFDQLDYMNSSGIGLLVTMLIRANRQNQRMLAVGLNEHYRHIFELTRLDEAIQICESEAQALAMA